MIGPSKNERGNFFSKITIENIENFEFIGAWIWSRKIMDLDIRPDPKPWLVV